MIALPPLSGSSNVSVKKPSPGPAENPVGLAGVLSSECTAADRFDDFFRSAGAPWCRVADGDGWFPGAAKAGAPSMVAEAAASASAPATDSQRRWRMSEPRPHGKYCHRYYTYPNRPVWGEGTAWHGMSRLL